MNDPSREAHPRHGEERAVNQSTPGMGDDKLSMRTPINANGKTSKHSNDDARLPGWIVTRHNLPTLTAQLE